MHKILKVAILIAMVGVFFVVANIYLQSIIGGSDQISASTPIAGNDIYNNGIWDYVDDFIDTRYTSPSDKK